MLAYTTLSDFLYLPSILETGIYLGGLLLVIALPILYLTLANSRHQKARTRQQSEQTHLN